MIVDQEKDVAIRQYSLQESSSLGSSVFEITKAGGNLRKLRSNVFVPHRKDYYFLCLVKAGNSHHWVDFIPYTTQPNRLYFTSPQQVQVKEETEPMDVIILSFTEEYLQLDENHSLRQLPIIQNPENSHELKLLPDHVLFIEDLLGKMLVEFNAGQTWRTGMLHAYMSVLLIYLSRLYTEQYQADTTSPDRTLLNRFRTYIDSRYHTLHQVADYADLLNLTPGHLNDRIKQQSGKTAIEHIHERLVLEAKRRLLHTNLSAKEIAWQLGFEDAAYFHRFFKRLAGNTPANFRTTIREMYH
ncbi:helix-turn-helix domain-containing protein [Spirosoma utsteinense]|uniref:AraC-like DNA-binding protein n=1 Tax=Spirosoma utsteinense TaxID=2585773 RepID=A0ABR6W445_9BACT|nr:AraC family transcriptional regulator [Spirosoma utsteinense]MBC3784727.1 AraC-like DNA-binding protein [Spirosoma utsteinense]MBC3791237.1 AraC-like DNA-binding protein [Spirosoma utsteinense]